MEFKVTGLNKKAKYVMMLDIVPADAYRSVMLKVDLFKSKLSDEYCKANVNLNLRFKAHMRSLGQKY